MIFRENEKKYFFSVKVKKKNIFRKLLTNNLLTIFRKIFNISCLKLTTFQIQYPTGLFFFPANKCKSPFPSTFDNQYFSKLWSGLFKCPYDPEDDPSLVSKVGMFVRYFYMTTGESTYQKVSVLNMTQLINPNYPNFIIIHGFTDGVRPGGINCFQTLSYAKTKFNFPKKKKKI